MASARYTITTDPQGYRVAYDFDDTISATIISKAAICRIVVRHGSYINSLTVHYVGSNVPATTRGGLTGKQDEIVLEPDEWITSFNGYTRPNVVTLLKFVSNKGRTWGPFGRSDGLAFTVDPSDKVPPYLASRMGLLYFSGNAGSYIRLLQATFAEYPGHKNPPKPMKFEEQTNGDALSKFAKQLMSPIVTLRVGSDSTVFRAYEDILCRLPFFRAALQGEFKEASEKTITMPEDEPETIAALIEFLYTGNYTYTYEPQAEGGTSETEGIPTSDVTQGSFHVAVYAVAFKYDCQLLVEEAVGNFTSVLKDLKGIDVVRLWKAAYANGLLLSQLETDGDLHELMPGLPKLVGGLYKTHRKEMENMVSEYPALASDFLCLITTGSGV